MRLLPLLLAAVALSPAALAQTPGDCDLGTAETDLNIGDVQAKLFNTGSLFYGGSTTNGLGYLVPKGDRTPPIFASGLWVAGLVNGDLRAAGSRYDDFEFWPGPLNEDGTLPNPNDCSAYDRIWNVSVFDLQQYDDTGIATADLAEWPVELGAAVVDGDGTPDNYDLAAGDRPLVYGHQTAFWVMNDVGNEHRESRTEPLGLEVRVTAFASGELALDRHTFYRYELVNRNSVPFEEARFTFFADSDLGDAADDFIGSDSTRSMAFSYNEAEEDGVYPTPPAIGYDLLTGGDTATYFQGAADPAIGDPDTGTLKYNFMQGRWGDGTPVTEGGDGYMTDGDTTVWVFPGDPVTGQFWSEENPDGTGVPNPSGDRRNIISSPAFTLAPGEAKTFDLALLFRQGDDRLASVALLQAASDAVQTRYDAGTLFVPGPTPPGPGFLGTPTLLTPDEGATFVDVEVPLSWTAAPETDSYRIEVASDADFAEREVFYSAETSFVFEGEINELATYSWRVQATARGLLTGDFSDVRSFTFYRYEADGFGSGSGIVEVANPSGAVCPDAGDPGCDRYGGNTVWLDPNATADYVLTNPDTDLDDLLRNENTIEGDDFEMRFTDTCASPGACLGVYSVAVPGGTNLITSVPFELWNTGAKDDDTDEVRMIPVLRAPSGQDPIANWANAYTAEQAVIAGDDTLTLNATHRVLWTMPDRPNGYALFEAAANGFGGAGATYDPENDGDTQDDPMCNARSQGYYIDFCYRGADARFVAPVGGLDGIQLADLAGDGATPPVGTVIRFDANERLLPVSAEDQGPGQPTGFSLGAAYPNPFRSSTTVPFEVGQAGRVRLSVIDVLGREVAVLEDGEMVAGTHRATLNGARLASGVYLVVLEADGWRQAMKVLLLR